MLDAFLSGPDGLRIKAVIETCGADVFPPTPFRAFELTPLEEAKVVILGQDPYHTPGKAMGLSFSVPNGEKLPPSLKNIFKELQQETAGVLRTRGSLLDWAEQGVFLLNAILTVEAGKPLSHAGLGWEVFTDKVIEALSTEGEGRVFMLWGNSAKKKRSLIDEAKNLVIASSHPSPFSALKGADPFMQSRCFTLANDWLAAHGRRPIDWTNENAGESLQASLFD